MVIKNHAFYKKVMNSGKRVTPIIVLLFSVQSKVCGSPWHHFFINYYNIESYNTKNVQVLNFENFSV